MKKFTKVVSVILIISAMLMATLVPAFAAFPDDAEAYIWTTKEQTSDPEIYKITVHLEANYPVAVGDLRVYWPTAEWKLIRNTGVKNSSVTARNAINYLGAFLDNEEYDDTDYEEEYVMGPGASDLNVIVKVDAKFFNEAVPQSIYSAIQLAWITGNENHYYYDSTRWGNSVYEFYVQNIGGDPAAQIANVDVRADAPLADAACWSSTDNSDTAVAVEAWQGGGHTKNFASTYFHAPQTSILNHWKPQIRFQKTDEGKYAEKFDFRTLATITKEDFDATFDSVEEAMTAIKRVGFIYAKTSDVDSMDLATVKEYVESGNYVPADSKDKSIPQNSKYVDVSLGKITTGFKGAGDSYVISCLIKNIPDEEGPANGLHAVGYMVYEKDGELQYAYYTDVVTTPFSGLYDHYIVDVRNW